MAVGKMRLMRMMQFYNAYCDQEKLAPLVRELAWTKNLIWKVKNDSRWVANSHR
jgi:hypothetical protein